MSKRLENILSLLVYILPIFIFLFAILFLFVVRRVPGVHQDQVGELTPIYDKQSLTQSITLEQSGLDTIMVFLKNAKLDNKDKFIFKILDREIIINGYNIGDGDTVKFQFPPINLPAGSQVRFILSAPETKNPDLAIKAGVSTQDAYSNGKLGEKFGSRDLSFQLFYQPNSKNDLIVSSLRQFFLRVLK